MKPNVRSGEVESEAPSLHYGGRRGLNVGLNVELGGFGVSRQHQPQALSSKAPRAHS
jgi:hypothetical protein